MGDENDMNAPVAVMLQLDPGASIARHSHPCERFEVITAGSLITEGLIVVPGDVMVASGRVVRACRGRSGRSDNGRSV
jgi:quercetin dioxygenase-like cupin family protein